MEKYSYWTFDQRREIERMHNAGVRTVEIAGHIGKSVADVYEELKRGYTGERNANKQKAYSTEWAQSVFQDNIARRGYRRAAGTTGGGTRIYAQAGAGVLVSAEAEGRRETGIAPDGAGKKADNRRSGRANERRKL